MVQMHWDDAEELLQDVLKDHGVEREGSDSHCPEALLLQAQLLLRLLALKASSKSPSRLGNLRLMEWLGARC